MASVLMSRNGGAQAAKESIKAGFVFLVFREDRCAFFVALSRAKRKITFTYCEYRYNFKYSKQNRSTINEFYDLLKKPGMANLITAREESL